MKKILLIVVSIITLFVITGCGKSNKSNKTEIIDYQLAENGDFVMAESEVKDEITFYNVNVNDINVQLIIVRASDGTIRTVFNTCQVCNPSPKAYFVREGDYLVCQNCGNRYHIDKLGLERGGCNPIPISGSEREDSDGNIIIPAELLEEMAPRFKNLAL
ncbi:MAG: DUF2318 domain-containing protein [Bacilli bacterium]|mgnify:CR=1 FL=1|nr:DUF2318 domain-containing protein [Bacilli bacterium]MDD4608360.1 DUF2318 domain-containing protein [Bacilli bacterium]